MDKIDVVLFRFKREKILSEEYKKRYRFTLIISIIYILAGLILVFLSPVGFVLCSILYLVPMLIVIKFWEGKWGTNKWKYKCMKTYREYFKLNQGKLLEIINDEEMNCQQVYNLLTKRHGRMAQGADKRTLIISFFSLVIACTSIFASPLQRDNMESYEQYVVYVIVILFALGLIANLFYRRISAQSKQYDEKKKDYEYILKLLEDYLY